eukprot:6270936-Prymnesium_polylepis.2
MQRHAAAQRRELALEEGEHSPSGKHRSRSRACPHAKLLTLGVVAVAVVELVLHVVWVPSSNPAARPSPLPKTHPLQPLGPSWESPRAELPRAPVRRRRRGADSLSEVAAAVDRLRSPAPAADAPAASTAAARAPAATAVAR